MTPPSPLKDPFFTSFQTPIAQYPLPHRFILMPGNNPHPLCLIAAEQLQSYLKSQNDWDHNFGLSPGKNGAVIGKMFGVLVVQTAASELGYLSAFSGKMGGGNDHLKFVPPVFDTLAANSFLTPGMIKLSSLNEEIKELEGIYPKDIQKISGLKTARKVHSSSLQQKLFDNYYFLNKAGEERSITNLFRDASYKNPPSGAGECAAPKLLQYAFQNNLRPLALAEFWWGLSPKSDQWKHKHFYPCCREKCGPILAHMLDGIDD